MINIIYKTCCAVLVWLMILTQVSAASNKMGNNMTEQDSKVDELFTAVERKELDVVKRLISSGMSPDTKNDDGKTILRAMYQIDGYIEARIDIVHYLIEQGADIDFYSGISGSLLHLAVIANFKPTVDLLLEKGIDTSIKTDFGQSAFFFANTPEMAEYLIEKKIGQFEDVDDDGDTLLHHAASGRPDIEMVKYLVDHIDVNSVNKDGDTPLIKSLKTDYFPEEVTSVVKFLLDKGADVNKPGEYQRSAVMVVIRNSSLDISMLEILFEAGANLSHKDNNGRSAVHYTAANNLEYLKYLSEKGADLNQLSAKNETTLMYAVEYNKEAIVNFLLDNNVDINIKNDDARTVLNYAQDKEYADLEKLLISKGAIATLSDVIEKLAAEKKEQLKQEEEKKKNAITDLDSAIKHKNLEQTKKFFKEKYNGPEAKEYNWHELLMLAIKVGDIEIFKYLLDSGLDVKSQDDDGYSLLHDAVFQNRIEMAKHLIDKGLDVNHVSDTGNSIFKMNANSSPEMLEFLISQGIKEDKEKEKNIVRSALNYRNAVMAEYFINKGYAFDKKILSNEKFLIKVIKYQNTEILEFLLKKGLDIETKLSIYGDKATLLHFSAMIKASKAAKFLLEAGANPNAVNTENKYVIEGAIKFGNAEILAMLLEHNANPNVTYGVFVDTPLASAFDKKNQEMIKVLVEKGADVNFRYGTSKNSAMHEAAQKGYIELLKNMIKHNGNVHLLNRDRKAPLDIAIDYGHEVLSEYLVEMEAVTE